jgi:uncharacterized OsmC-like protein
MVLTIAAVAEHKSIRVIGLAATVEGHTEFEGLSAATHFVSHLDLGEGLTPRELRILQNAARQCEVHKMLLGSVTFEEHVKAQS